jgi:hypothetical protein
MTIETKKIADMAALAEAAYANLTNRTFSGALANGMSGTQVSVLSSRYSVIEQQPNTGSGFSATLFKRTGVGAGPDEYVFATRGTEPITQWSFDLGLDIAADLGDLVLDGLAWEQIVDMYNFWKQLTAKPGETYQKAYFISSPYVPGSNIQGVIDKSFGPIVFLRKIEFQNATDGLGKIDPNTVVDVTGHSLGGHLSSAFSRLFPANTNTSYGINGAGYANILGNSNIEYVFSRLGGASTFNGNLVETLYGTAGPNVVTQNFGLVQVGWHDPLFIETGGPLAFGAVLGHSATQMTDSAAVYDIFIRLDKTGSYQSPSIFLPRILPIFENAAYSANRSLEEMVLSVARFFKLNDGEIATNDREALHSRIRLIEDSASFKGLESQLIVRASGLGLASAARNDFGALVSLLTLSPVWMTGAAAAGDQAMAATVGAAWGAKFTRQNKSEYSP